MRRIFFIFFYFIYKIIAKTTFKIFRKINPPISLSVGSKKKGQPSIFFHASSVGELEVLTPLIEQCASENREVHVSIFSSSAYWALKSLYEKLMNLNYSCGYFGYSPSEGEWKSFLEKIQPTFFVTDRYEAWPDLWVSLSTLKIPLYIVGARARKSLFLIKKIFYFFKIPLPQLCFFTLNAPLLDELKQEFPKVKMAPVGELRLDRIADRLTRCHPRSELLKKWILQNSDEKPILVLGSIWSEDLGVWKSVIEKYKDSLFFVLAPHKMDPRFIEEIKGFVLSMQKEVECSSLIQKEYLKNSKNKNFLILDEMGVLVELYALAQMVYIGGGWSAGVHSTLEPAVSLVPVACGLNGVSRFPEINLLIHSTQLTLVHSSKEIESWVFDVVSGRFHLSKNKWKDQLQEICDAKKRILLEFNKALVEIAHTEN